MSRTRAVMGGLAVLALFAGMGALIWFGGVQARERTRTLEVRLDGETGQVHAAFLDDLVETDGGPGDSRESVFLIRVDPETGAVDALDAGLPWYWLAFGFGAQILFTLRMLVQWIASERAQRSVVPPAFWVLSLLGGLTLLLYFVRRGDPVGVVGQAAGVFIYVRNLTLIHRAAGSISASRA